MRKLVLVLLVLALGLPLFAQSEDISSKVYGLQNHNDSSYKTFYVTNKQTYSSSGATFTQTYNNGTLVLGNNQMQTGSTSNKVWFGGIGAWYEYGLIGYITANFNAKTIYLTSTLGAGNQWGTGGGATLNFKASEAATLETLTLNLNKAGTQNSHFKVEGSSITINNSKLNAQTNGFSLLLKSTKDDIKITNSQAHFGGDITIDSGKDLISSDTATKINSTSGRISVTAKENIDFKGSMDFASGGATWDGTIKLEAGDKLDIATLKATLYSGKGQFLAKAKDLNIGDLNLHGNVGTAVNASNATFEADTIELNKAEIYSTRGINNATDNAGEFVVKFIAKDSIVLNNTNIRLTNQLESVGSPDSVVFESGGDLTHSGKLTTATAQQTWGGATFDFSKVKGKASVENIEIVAANVKMNSDFSAKSLVVQKRQTNGGQNGLGTKLWTNEGGKYKFDSIMLNDGTDLAADTARMTFVNDSGNNIFVKNSKLELGSLSVGKKGGFYASNITHTIATNLALDSSSTASFHHLTITPGGQITMDANNAKLVLEKHGDEVGVLELGVSIKDSGLHNGYGKPLLAITNAGDTLQNIDFKPGEVKRFVDAGEIKYNFVDSNGQTSVIHCDGSEREKCESIKDRIAIYAGSAPTINDSNYTTQRLDLSAIGLKYEKVLGYNYIGIKLSSNNADNPYQIDDIRYYLYRKCGQECVEKIGSISSTATITQGAQTQLDGDGNQVYVYEYKDDKGTLNKIFCQSTNTSACKTLNKVSKDITQVNATYIESDIFDWLNFLSIYDKGITWTGANVLNYDLDFFLHTATQLNNTLDQITSVDRKASAAASTRLAADIARSNRLVKLSNFSGGNTSNTFAALGAKSLAKLPHYAESSNIASDASPRKNPAFLYKFSNRHDFMNNIWATAIGSTSFVKNGQATLYGINVGYDRFIPLGESGLILGGSTSYGYGIYNADLLKNNSHNTNVGFYSRAFVANHEIDFTANYTLGINNEDIIARENPFLQSLAQSYGYNTHTININANYGYIFGTNNKSLVFKPMGGLSYYAINVGELNGGNRHITPHTQSTRTPDSSNIGIASPYTQRHLLALMLALETRQYFSQTSYWFINIGAQKDLYSSNGNGEMSIFDRVRLDRARFVGNNSLSYRGHDELNTHLLGTAGGEVLLGKQTFVNFALGTKIGLSYKDINLTANLGVRYVF